MCVKESSWAVVLSPAPLLQHGGLVFLCPCGVLPRFGRCKLRKYFTLRLCGLLWYLPLAGGQQFYPAGAASLLCWHRAPRALDLTCSCVGGESQFPGFPDSFPGGSQESFSCPTFCFLFPVSGEVKMISGFSASVHFKYETNLEMTFLQGKVLETELNKKITGLKCTNSCLILSTCLRFWVAVLAVVAKRLCQEWSCCSCCWFCDFLCLTLCQPLILIRLHVLVAVE